MKLFMYAQTSPEWWEVRRGVPTASNFHRIITPKTRKPSESQAKYINELIADTVCLNPNYFSARGRPVTPAMQHGTDAEPEARRWLEMELGVKIQQVGFCATDDGRAGCSPDGLIRGDEGCEIKCVQLDTQVEYLLNPDKLLDDYRCQVHGSMLITGRRRWRLLSYAYGRDLDPLLLTVEPDDFTDLLRKELAAFNHRYDAALKRLGVRRLYPTAEEADTGRAIDPADDGIGDPPGFPRRGGHDRPGEVRPRP